MEINPRTPRTVIGSPSMASYEAGLLNTNRVRPDSLDTVPRNTLSLARVPSKLRLVKAVKQVSVANPWVDDSLSQFVRFRYVRLMSPDNELNASSSRIELVPRKSRV